MLASLALVWDGYHLGRPVAAAAHWAGLLLWRHAGLHCYAPPPQAPSLLVLPLEESLQTAPPALLRFPLHFLLPDSSQNLSEDQKLGLQTTEQGPDRKDSKGHLPWTTEDGFFLWKSLGLQYHLGIRFLGDSVFVQGMVICQQANYIFRKIREIPPPF